ncbi:hypothetical protein BTJ35_08795 [Lactobacillus delbrueckii subsp. bulgaricus]|uniref:glycosyltransferase n=1 Tax=Lactobacillus delbrueckii TaxID=1584 RepID=UPI001BFF337F|nr:glycosyltransferase [Lactobacillus delbrueckii]MBT9089462.1 hypothetical protein [Lactobacillus delbrueckii subsp. bulgaricus]MBT9091104.1 hypothetical protein [Lactobacillus delbrueckii subsp. bulgaricus]MCD5455672.1 glycosyltransferase [Lactobacillus delbrueckii subsp. bulgaricus]MCD5476416.1 glycosyltransferase [Lactobacillus delbrueckii subsp. bulgaricus]MCT3498666.1 glycosyltransferase [Lactobacillus delbrueckii subsp. bulgaricus]
MKDAKKNILIVMMNLYNGGAERSLVNLLNTIDYDKYNIDLLLFQKKGMFLKQLPDFVNILDTPKDLQLLYNSSVGFKQIIGSKNYLLLAHLLGRAFMVVDRKDMIRKKRQIRWKYGYKKLLAVFPNTYDVALGYIEGEPSYYVMDKVKAKKKYIWVHNDYTQTGLDKSYDQPYFEKADKIVTISEKCADILKSEFPEQEDKILYLPNISSKKLLKRRSEENIPTEYDPTKFKVLSVGRLNPQKGFDIAIEAAAIFKKLNIPFQWIIIGEGKQRKYLQGLIDKYKLKSCVSLIGVKENPYPYMRLADILVQSSRYEGKSVVLDEAKMLGLPVIATNYPTVRDQVNDQWGYIVDMNAKSIAEQLLYVSNNRNELIKKKKLLVSLENNVNEQLSMYDDLLQS